MNRMEMDSAFIKLFGSTPRLRLIDFFLDNPRHDFNCDEIIEALRMSRNTLYRHLPILREAGAIKVSRRAGKIIYYALDSSSQIVKLLIDLDAELTKPPGPSTICSGCGKTVVMKTTITRGGYMVETCPECGYERQEPDEDG